MPNDPKEEGLLEFLNTFVSEHKKELFEKVLAQRTRHITVVLENIYQPHNANAVLRTCEALGVQDVHIIEDRNPFQLSLNVTQGSAKWLDLEHYSKEGIATKECVDTLRASGYKLACATPHAELTIDQLNIQEPLAICFGTELTGASDELIEACDVQFKLPMFGFTESYNISVSAALVLYDLVGRMRGSDKEYGLSENEKQSLRLLWAKKTVHEPEKLGRYFDEKWASDAQRKG